MPSFSIRCIFQCPKEQFNELKFLYEERITVWQANDLDEALDKGVAEAEKYAAENNLQYLGLAQGFWLFTEIEVHAVEVFSLMRESDLDAGDYLDAFFSTGNERQSRSG